MMRNLPNSDINFAEAPKSYISGTGLLRDWVKSKIFSRSTGLIRAEVSYKQISFLDDLVSGEGL